MTFIDIQNIIKGKLKLQGNERSEMALVKSAINQAYVAFAERDLIIDEQAYSEYSSTVVLPVNFLVYHSLYITVIDVSLAETTFKIPRHYLEIKANKLLLRDDVAAVGADKSIKLIYGVKPVNLIADEDVPVINARYHVGLVYYALFLITDNKIYYELYMTIYNSIVVDDYVSNYTNVIDVL